MHIARFSTVLCLVRSAATSSSLITLRHSRGRRPAQRTRTPSASSSSVRWRVASRERPIRTRPPSGLRRQFSVENAYSDSHRTPSSMHPRATSTTPASPRLCPSIRVSPRWFAHRPLPSITIATCRGTSSGGIAGGRAPDGCGSGGSGVFVLARRRSKSILQDSGPPTLLTALHDRRRDGPALHQRQRTQLALEMPLQQRRDQPAAL